MPRKIRLEYEGAIYHVMSRGDRKEDIFICDRDRESFLETLGEVCGKTAWQIHAYCLMRNHFHMVVETPRPNLSAGMHWFLGTYTTRFNWRHQVGGHVFSGRYKGVIVDGSGNGYLKTVCDYVHLNPVRANLLSLEEDLEAFPWSSYPEYLKKASKRPEWLRVDRLLGEWGAADTLRGRRVFQAGMAQRKDEEMEKPSEEWKGLRWGWYWGPEDFRRKLLEMIEEEKGRQHYGEELRESEEQKAERLIGEMLNDLGWTMAELRRRPKGDPKKAKLAKRLRSETTMTWPWIAERLTMGHWRTAANAVRICTSGDQKRPERQGHTNSHL